MPAVSRPPTVEGGDRADGYEALLQRIGRDASDHMIAGPVSQEDLARLASEIGRPLPAQYRMFLERLGGGIYYGRHEIFGPVRAMIHDIEMVPPLTRVCRGLPPGVIPVHRAGTIIHFMDLRHDAAPVPVFSLLSAEHYPDFATFLREVVVPRPGSTVNA